MTDIHIRKQGRAGRITLTRPKAMNALSYEMALAVEQALDAWADDDTVALIVIDAEGDRAFCAGGDIDQLYHSAKAGDHDFGRKFWADEYRMNARMHTYPKPVVSFLQGFVMGGGVGVGGHGSHRVVGDSTQIAMPECGIGLIPDVGGSLILARAPGRIGEYLGLSGTRMGAGDAIYTGFATDYIPELEWSALITQLEETGDADLVGQAARPAPASPLQAAQTDIDTVFAGDTLHDLMGNIPADPSPVVAQALKLMGRNSPLSMACALATIHRVRAANTIYDALNHEYRFTWRSTEDGEFIEGIRAAIIDKDRNPQWRHASWKDVTQAEVDAMTAPIPGVTLDFKGRDAQ